MNPILKEKRGFCLVWPSTFDQVHVVLYKVVLDTVYVKIC